MLATASFVAAAVSLITFESFSLFNHSKQICLLERKIALLPMQIVSKKSSFYFMLMFLIVEAILLMGWNMILTKDCDNAHQDELKLEEFKNESNAIKYHMKAFDIPLIILFWTRWFGIENFNDQFTVKNCPLPSEIPVELMRDQVWCQYSHNRSLSNSASIVGFHVRDTSTNDLPQKLEQQDWLLLTQESPKYDYMATPDKFIADYDKLRLFDLSMTYRLDSTFPYPYMSQTQMKNILTYDTPGFHDRRSISRGEAPILWLAHNCNAFNKREKYLEELSKYVPIDFRGPCMLNTDPFPNGGDTVGLMKQYKFYLALENSNCFQYVSEKVYNALAAGAVPIVLGPPGSNGSGYKQFVPTWNSVIYLSEYPDPKDLAKLLRQLESNETLWEERREYRRTRKYSEEFTNTWLQEEEFYHEWGLCGACRHAARKKWSGLKGYSSFISKPRRATSFQVDYSCLPNGKISDRGGFDY